jgi:hypothetical protein
MPPPPERSVHYWLILVIAVLCGLYGIEKLLMKDVEYSINHPDPRPPSIAPAVPAVPESTSTTRPPGPVVPGGATRP